MVVIINKVCRSAGTHRGFKSDKVEIECFSQSKIRRIVENRFRIEKIIIIPKMPLLRGTVRSEVGLTGLFMALKRIGPIPKRNLG